MGCGASSEPVEAEPEQPEPEPETSTLSLSATTRLKIERSFAEETGDNGFPNFKEALTPSSTGQLSTKSASPSSTGQLQIIPNSAPTPENKLNAGFTPHPNNTQEKNFADPDTTKEQTSQNASEYNQHF